MTWPSPRDWPTSPPSACCTSARSRPGHALRAAADRSAQPDPHRAGQRRPLRRAGTSVESAFPLMRTHARRAGNRSPRSPVPWSQASWMRPPSRKPPHPPEPIARGDLVRGAATGPPGTGSRGAHHSSSWPCCQPGSRRVRSTASSTHVPVEQHADQQHERVAAEQVVRGVVLGDPEGRHRGSVPHQGSGRSTAVPPAPAPRACRRQRRGDGGGSHTVDVTPLHATPSVTSWGRSSWCGQPGRGPPRRSRSRRRGQICSSPPLRAATPGGTRPTASCTMTPTRCSPRWPIPARSRSASTRPSVSSSTRPGSC